MFFRQGDYLEKNLKGKKVFLKCLFRQFHRYKTKFPVKNTLCFLNLKQNMSGTGVPEFPGCIRLEVDGRNSVPTAVNEYQLKVANGTLFRFF